jgi:hypothetical protein
LVMLDQSKGVFVTEADGRVTNVQGHSASERTGRRSASNGGPVRRSQGSLSGSRRQAAHDPKRTAGPPGRQGRRRLGCGDVQPPPQ